MAPSLPPHSLGGPAFAPGLDTDSSDDDLLPDYLADRGNARAVPSLRYPEPGESPKRPRPRITTFLSESEEEDLINDAQSSPSPKKRPWSSTDVRNNTRLPGSRVDENIRNDVAEGSNFRRLSVSNTDIWQTTFNSLPTHNTNSPSFHATSPLSQHGQLPLGSLQDSLPGPLPNRLGGAQAFRRFQSLAGSSRDRRLQDVMRLVENRTGHSASPTNGSLDRSLKFSSTSHTSVNDTEDPFTAIMEEIRKSNPLQTSLDNGEGPSVLLVYHHQSPSRATFSPACIVSGNTSPPSTTFGPNGAANHNLRSSRATKPPLKLHIFLPENFSWPKGKLPVEIYELIAEHLSRDDIKNMRLVNREFEQRISRVLFSTVVVPFNTEIYGMLNPTRQARSNRKGKQKAVDNDYREPSTSLGYLKWPNAKEDQLYTGHGIDVFRGFGPHIRKYGMSFDVSEGKLEERC